ncbi:2752_t:CDS:2 [Cetraspora pellucida]|uniref:2752_t:CDS:1 n=1 Tax=Cetraspora pellucida TaxID=1433469 RepID=A0A9N9F4T8_9GLOM|nr:2752_t:CDS:2 [Cetraspora pellucida]
MVSKVLDAYYDVLEDPAGVEVDLDKLLQELEAECNSIARKWPCQEKEAIEIEPCQHNRIIVKKNRQGMKIRAYEDDVTRHILLKDDAEKDEPMNSRHGLGDELEDLIDY